MSAPRTRTVSWEDPAAVAEAGAQLSGLDYLRAIQAGEMPAAPIALLLGMGIDEVEEGRVVFTIEPAEHLYNPIGMVHGGAAATVCDSAMGCAVHSMLPGGVGYSTLEIKVNYVRAMRAGSGPARCEGKIIHLGGRVATAEARMVDGAGRLVAHATTTCLIIRP